MQVDIRQIKKQLRANYRAKRAAFTDAQKVRKDKAMTERLMQLKAYRNCKTLLCYFPVNEEIDTTSLMIETLKQGKKLALPYCVEGSREMEFYCISSFDELEPRTFGVPEPIPSKCEKLTNFSNSLCIVPALVYDFSGFRLGYGGGYYDRFLSNYQGVKVGLVYEACLVKNLPRGRFDRAVDWLITEKRQRFLPKKP